MDTMGIAIIGATVVSSMTIAGLLTLRGWREWLEIRRAEIAGHRMIDVTPAPAGGRIEIADLKERIRKLEAIAAGIDL